MRCAGIVLAAGASTRLGYPKQEVDLGGDTLLERAVRTAVTADLAPVFLVVAAGYNVVFSLHAVVRLVPHSEAAEGMAASLRAGIRAVKSGAEGATGVVVLACDQPAVTAAHLRALADGGQAALASAYGGRKGVPAYFPASAFADLLKLTGDRGAQVLLRDAAAIPLELGEIDVDTVEDLARARALFGAIERA